VTDFQEGFVLHSRQYRESSVILELFTSNEGRVAAVAKGMRGDKARRGLSAPFQKVSLKLGGRRRGGLGNLEHIEAAGPAIILTQLPLFCGYYVNELMLKLLLAGEASETLFAGYERVLNALSSVKPTQRDALEVCLREFEFALLAELGIALDFSRLSGPDIPVAAAEMYWIAFDRGISKQQDTDALQIGGETLLAIANRDWHARSLLGAKQINRYFFDRLLENKQLYSRKMIRDYIEVTSE